MYRGQALPDEKGLLDDLPAVLHEKLMFKRYGGLLKNVRFFQDLHSAELHELACFVHFYQFSPGDVILYNGDVGNELYCIKRGHVEVGTVPRGVDIWNWSSNGE